MSRKKTNVDYTNDGAIDDDNLTDYGAAVSFENLSFKVSQKQIKISEEFVRISIDTIPVSRSLKNTLKNLYIDTLGDLNGFSLDDIARSPNCGEKRVAELCGLINQNNYGETSVPVEITPEVAEILQDWQQILDSKRNKLTDSKLKRKIRIPVSFANVLFANLPFSPKLQHVIFTLGVLRLGDLEKFSLGDVLQTFYCGKKSVFVLHAFLTAIQNFDRKRKGDQAATVSKEVNELRSVSDLITLINSFVKRLSERDGTVLRDRFGGNIENKIITLEMIGADQLTTRQRVEQIEKQTLQNLKSFVGDSANKIFASLRAECLTNIRPVTPKLLLLLSDKNLDVFQHPLPFYIRLIGYLSPDLPVLPTLRSKIKHFHDKKELQMVADIKTLFKTSATSAIALSDVFKRIPQDGSENGSFERNFFYAIRSERFNIEESNDPRILTLELNRKRLRNDEFVRKVLERSSCVLSPEEITERGTLLFEEKGYAVPSISKILNTTVLKKGIYLLDSRRLGLRTHFRLPEDLWNTVRHDFICLLKEGNNRPLSTRQVFKKKMFAWCDMTNAIEVAQILREDSRFSDLGRLYFTLAGSGNQKRESLDESVINALRGAGHPLRFSQIASEIKNSRSGITSRLSGFLRVTQTVENYGCGFYGLKEFDENAVRAFLATNELFVNKFVLKATSSLMFDELCLSLKIGISSETADELWKTLESLPNVTTALAADCQPRAAAMIFHRSWNSPKKRKQKRKDEDS